MAKPRALVLTGYGINCDWEKAFAFEKAGASVRTGRTLTTRVFLDGAEIPVRYDEHKGIAYFHWSEDPVPTVDQDLTGPWKLKPESLPDRSHAA